MARGMKYQMQLRKCIQIIIFGIASLSISFSCKMELLDTPHNLQPLECLIFIYTLLFELSLNCSINRNAFVLYYRYGVTLYSEFKYDQFFIILIPGHID